MSQVFIALGSVAYEGDEILGVYDSDAAAHTRCVEVARRQAEVGPPYYSVFYVKAWTLGKVNCDESTYIPRESLITPKA